MQRVELSVCYWYFIHERYNLVHYKVECASKINMIAALSLECMKKMAMYVIPVATIVSEVPSKNIILLSIDFLLEH